MLSNSKIAFCIKKIKPGITCIRHHSMQLLSGFTCTIKQGFNTWILNFKGLLFTKEDNVFISKFLIEINNWIRFLIDYAFAEYIPLQAHFFFLWRLLLLSSLFTNVISNGQSMTRIADKRYPPPALIFMLGCIRPGNTWYCLRKLSVISALIKSRDLLIQYVACNSTSLLKLYTTTGLDPLTYFTSSLIIDSGEQFDEMTKLWVLSVTYFTPFTLLFTHQSFHQIKAALILFYNHSCSYVEYKIFGRLCLMLQIVHLSIFQKGLQNKRINEMYVKELSVPLGSSGST